MPIKILGSGASVIIDDEDVEVFEGRAWGLFTLSPSRKQCVCRKDVQHCREFRVLLHREVAIHMMPDLIPERRRFTVRPKNGDYLDCRRENLEVRVIGRNRPGRKKIDPRPCGSAIRSGFRKSNSGRPGHEPSSLWTGGYVYKEIDATHRGESRRIRKLLYGKPID